MLIINYSAYDRYLPAQFQKTQINAISLEINKSTLVNGVDASDVLMNSWFHKFKPLQDQQLNVSGMVKKTKKCYIVNRVCVSLKQFYRLLQTTQLKKDCHRSMHILIGKWHPSQIGLHVKLQQAK
ncbi:hypothetical protein [Sporosarcina obsidiansis]|uniref:hypothetical protein n=1 Tax=Sporosarcina obsidiansis TaxID=2660748 RepID=UPI00129BF5CD|nr:hypothetical protein [Sporosarcina obsidiansis]